MSTFLQQLLAILQGLQPAPGTPPQAVDEMLRALAASLILQNPANATLPPGVELDPRIVAAVQAGAAQAAALKAAGKGLRLVRESLPLGTLIANQPEHRSEILGPFVEVLGRLCRFVTIETPAFLNVNARFLAGPQVGELLLLIPAGSTPIAPDMRRWQLPSGTVWIASKFFVAGAPNFAGVRITDGLLEFTQNVVRHGGLLLAPGTLFTLTLNLEQPAEPVGGSSDADAITLKLPTQLVVHSNGAPPTVSDNALLSGFGSDLNLMPGGAASFDGKQICLPMQAAEPLWTISGNSSRLTQFSCSAQPENARFAVPVSPTTPTQLGEAAHGGSILFSVGDGLRSTLTAQTGDVSRWSVATITASARHLEVQSLQPTSGAGYDLALWSQCLTKARFAGNPVTSMVFRSERGGFDTVGVVGGACTNQWDLPRRSDDQPFTFAGTFDVFGFVASPTTFLVALIATSPRDPSVQGFALENLYVLVRPPRRLSLVALFDIGPELPSGTAVLSLDVLSALPTLPDPYASNLTLAQVQAETPNALRVVLQWDESQSPTIAANLDTAVPFPEPTFSILDDLDERIVSTAFHRHLAAQNESLFLLDLSSREHLFGVAIEPFSANKPDIIDNRLTVALSRIRLFMQPQVQWEAVCIEANPDVGLAAGFGSSRSNGGVTLVGAQSVKLVPALPGLLSSEIIGAIRGSNPAAALFSLPFGLRAMTSLDFIKQAPVEGHARPSTSTLLNEPSFGDLTSARQIRLTADNLSSTPNPSRVMPGMIRQLANFKDPLPGLTMVLPNETFRGAFNDAFQTAVPLHRADLSGYGLSSFSEWSQDVEGAGFSKVEFRILNGRTAYEVIQFRSILYECGARTVRTVILERHNSGRVFRTDTGWVAVDAGEFKRPNAFQKGAVKSFQNIRRIRVTGAPITLTGSSFVVEPVIFDADASIDGASQPLIPIYDRPGYIQIQPVAAPVPPTGIPNLQATQIEILRHIYTQFHAIASPIDASVRIGATLQAQLTSIVSDLALDDIHGVGFAVAIVGAPKLPRAGQWSVVCIDPNTHETTPTDPRRGVPLVRNGVGSFQFREPSDTRRTTALVDYALLMSTDTSRVLFQRPSISITQPGKPGSLHFDLPPLFADPYSLVQSTGAFPRPNFGLRLDHVPLFTITPDDLWSIDNPVFHALKPVGDFMSGGGWGLNRGYDDGEIKLAIDSSIPKAFDLAIPPSVLKLQLPSPLDEIINIRNTYQNAAGEISKLADPEVIFKGALQKLTEILDSLAAITGLPFHFDVSITAGTGPSPSFVVHMHLLFRIGNGPDGRVEVGLGKFYGQFSVDGQLEASMTGVENAALTINFQGDIQQGIFPPLLYAGGLMRFNVDLDSDGAHIEFTLGIVISIGGDLIPELLTVEGTISYGYSLIPESLSPGIFLGLEARAKLLAGLIGFSFSVEASATVKRNADPLFVTIAAKLRIAATVQIAIFIEEDIDFETQFQQDIPVIAFALVPGGLTVVAAEAAV